MTGKSQKSPVSALIFTLNEERNLPDCLASLGWCDDIFVIDSHSNDSTRRICEARGIHFVQHVFEGFGSQRNWALDTLDLKYDWVLILDADERVPPELALELDRLARSSAVEIAAYRVRRRFHLWGKWLRYSSLYPTWVVRFIRRNRVRYINRGHGETQTVDGTIGKLDGYLVDENLNGLDAWFERQVRYARKDAEHELDVEHTSRASLSLLSRDPLQRRAALKRLVAALPFRSSLYFFYSYVFRLGFLDGRDGLTFCRMKAMYQDMVEIHKHDLKKRTGTVGVKPRESKP
jgi:glycosyltransferase involved in cell wall biosynthesis